MLHVPSYILLYVSFKSTTKCVLFSQILLNTQQCENWQSVSKLLVYFLFPLNPKPLNINHIIEMENLPPLSILTILLRYIKVPIECICWLENIFILSETIIRASKCTSFDQMVFEVSLILFYSILNCIPRWSWSKHIECYQSVALVYESSHPDRVLLWKMRKNWGKMNEKKKNRKERNCVIGMRMY